jgi:hypothetical protein
MEADLYLLFKDRAGNVFGSLIYNPVMLTDFTAEVDTAIQPELHVTICDRLIYKQHPYDYIHLDM